MSARTTTRKADFHAKKTCALSTRYVTTHPLKESCLPCTPLVSARSIRAANLIKALELAPRLARYGSVECDSTPSSKLRTAVVHELLDHPRVVHVTVWQGHAHSGATTSFPHGGRVALRAAAPLDEGGVAAVGRRGSRRMRLVRDVRLTLGLQDLVDEVQQDALGGQCPGLLLTGSQQLGRAGLQPPLLGLVGRTRGAVGPPEVARVAQHCSCSEGSSTSRMRRTRSLRPHLQGRSTCCSRASGRRPSRAPCWAPPARR